MKQDKLASALQKYLSLHGETQENLAARAGILRQTVGKVLAGSDPRASTLKALDEATGGLVGWRQVEKETRKRGRK